MCLTEKQPKKIQWCDRCKSQHEMPRCEFIALPRSEGGHIPDMNPIVAVQCTKCTLRCEDERYFAITNLTPCSDKHCDGRMEFQFQDQLDEIKNSWSKLFEREQQQEKFITEEEEEEEDKTCWTCKKEYEVEPGRGGYDGHQCFDCFQKENGADEEEEE